MENDVRRIYGKDTRPPGEWVRATASLSVQGLAANLRAVIAFADAVEAAKKKGLRYGIDLAAEDAEHPDRGLLVVGGAETKGFFSGRKVSHWPLGHLSPKVAREIHDDLIAKGIPIAAELSAIHYDHADPKIEIYILAPNGHSARDRDRRRRSGSS
jgi:hypothetical protein